MLRRGSQDAGAIAQRFPGISRPAVSKHLAVLRRAHLVVARRHGRQLRYSLNAAPLAEVDAWLCQYQTHWDQQLRSFKNHLESNGSGKEDKHE